MVTVFVVVGLIGSTIPPAGAQGAKPKADDVGITENEIRLAVIADVDTPVQPGLFQKSVDAMNAWAKTVNKAGGIVGRKIVIDFIDSKLSPNETRNAIIKACANDFAMVGGEALFLNNTDDMVACKNSAGEAVGLPDLPGLALDTNQQCSPVTYIAAGLGSYCATKDQHPQTYTVLQGDYLYYLKKNKDLHGIWTVPGDLAATKNAVLATANVGVNAGIKKDGDGFYSVFSREPQSAMTPIVQAIKQNSSNFADNGGALEVLPRGRREPEQLEIGNDYFRSLRGHRVEPHRMSVSPLGSRRIRGHTHRGVQSRLRRRREPRESRQAVSPSARPPGSCRGSRSPRRASRSPGCLAGLSRLRRCSRSYELRVPARAGGRAGVRSGT